MKNFYYDLKEYSNINKIAISEETLFLFIQESIKNNFKLSYYIRYIKSLDVSLCSDDICSDCYLKSLKLFNRKNNINMYDLINILRHIISYNSTTKRKHYHEEISEDILNIKDNNIDLDDKLIIEDCLSYIKGKDEIVEKCVRMYLNGNSYRNIAKELNMVFRNVKNKIDKGLKLIIEYKGLD